MASTAAIQASCSFLIRLQERGSSTVDEHRATRQGSRSTRRTNLKTLRVFASQEQPKKGRRPPPGVDTRIHWENEDEGWVGGTSSSQKSKLDADEERRNLLGEKFADLLNESSDSHYQFLGVPPEADMEEIKAAYRRLSKEYHPDTTSLPLKAALEKFMKLREIYNVLSNEESRRFYDWTLAQEAASRKTEKLRMRFEDPFQQDVINYVPKPDLVDRLGGKNTELGGMAAAALTFDIFAFLIAIFSIIYYINFKEY